MGKIDFFTGYSEANRYVVQELIGKGSYGIVCSALDTQTGEKVAIKKINDVFQHVSDAIRILREIKLLRLLRHPDIVEIKHILLPPSPRDFKDIYVVFELMESDLHQVIKANDDLTGEHFQFFLYQMIRALKFIHTANVFHRDLKPKNILANSDCKLKVCDFGLARVTMNGSSSAIFWTDYVATRWYRAPELCGSFYQKYTTAVDMWSIGCIFAELLTGEPLFPGRNVAHQLDLITDLLGTPSQEAIAKIKNDKARKYLAGMRKKSPTNFQLKFPNVHPSAVRLLQRLLAFDAKDRPTAEEALADPYFKRLSKIEREPSSEPVPKSDFEFEKKHLTKDDVRSLIYREILEYHPEMLKSHLNIKEQSRFLYPSAVEQLRRQFDYLQKQQKDSVKMPLERKPTSLPRERIKELHEETQNDVKEKDTGLLNASLNRNPGNRPIIGPHKVVPGESLKSNKPIVSHSIENTPQEMSSNVQRLVRNASNLFQKSGSLSVNSHLAGESLKSTKPVPVSHSIDDTPQEMNSNVQKLVRNASNLFQKSGSLSTHARMEMLKATKQTGKIPKVEQSDKPVTHSKTRSMGMTVAKLVAAFSNGLTH